MPHTNTPELRATTGEGAAVFSAREWNGFQAEDRQAARNIVGLMVTIFTLGLLGYLTIDLLIG